MRRSVTIAAWGRTGTIEFSPEDPLQSDPYPECPFEDGFAQMRAILHITRDRRCLLELSQMLHLFAGNL